MLYQKYTAKWEGNQKKEINMKKNWHEGTDLWGKRKKSIFSSVRQWLRRHEIIICKYMTDANNTFGRKEARHGNLLSCLMGGYRFSEKHLLLLWNPIPTNHFCRTSTKGSTLIGLCTFLQSAKVGLRISYWRRRRWRKTYPPAHSFPSNRHYPSCSSLSAGDPNTTLQL